jgi:serine/threonine protein kinase
LTIREAIEQLFRYTDLSTDPIGRGGCGHIWRAYDLLFDRNVAIKTIDEVLLWDLGIKAKRSFVKEAQAGARLGELSRHIVKVYDLGIIENVPYFVMQWINPVEGRSSIDLSPDESGIVHSDIAPWNIVYDPSERVYKLADFGLLKIMERNVLSQASGSLLTGGRADFFPLTVRLGEEPISYASDVYALAVTLRALLEGIKFLTIGGDSILPTPGVIRARHDGNREAPPQVRQLLLRFIDGHTPDDNVHEFQAMLQRIPS